MHEKIACFFKSKMLRFLGFGWVFFNLDRFQSTKLAISSLTGDAQELWNQKL